MTTSVLDLRPLTGSKLEVKVETELQRLPDGQKPTASQHMFRIMHPEHGDERLVWNSGVFADIKEAKRTFIELVKKGLKPFRVGTDGKASAEAMSEFDPLAEEVIFMPQALVTGG